MSPELISKKLKTFAHSEFSSEKFSSVDLVKKKIEQKIDLFERGEKYNVIKIDKTFPEYLTENLDYYKNYIVE